LSVSDAIRRYRYGSSPVRLLIARCEVRYAGRLSAKLPEALRLVVFKSDGSVMVHADSGGYKPENWMTPPTAIEEHGAPLEQIVVRKLRSDERLDIAISEVVSDLEFELGEAEELEKEGVETELQEALAASPGLVEQGLRLVRREWPTDVGPVDLMCRDAAGGWVAVEVKRVATIEAVEQLCRYLEALRRDPQLGGCRGVLAAQVVKPQAGVLAAMRGLTSVEVDLDVARGLREPELTLF
jgi:RecB family endonuclease NucS